MATKRKGKGRVGSKTRPRFTTKRQSKTQATAKKQAGQYRYQAQRGKRTRKSARVRMHENYYEKELSQVKRAVSNRKGGSVKMRRIRRTNKRAGALHG